MKQISIFDVPGVDTTPHLTPAAPEVQPRRVRQAKTAVTKREFSFSPEQYGRKVSRYLLKELRADWSQFTLRNTVEGGLIITVVSSGTTEIEKAVKLAKSMGLIFHSCGANAGKSILTFLISDNELKRVLGGPKPSATSENK